MENDNVEFNGLSEVSSFVGLYFLHPSKREIKGIIVGSPYNGYYFVKPYYGSKLSKTILVMTIDEVLDLNLYEDRKDMENVYYNLYGGQDD